MSTQIRTRILHRLVPLLALWLLGAGTVLAQQTAAIGYQGRLTEGGSPATGAYDMQFKLFDAPEAGAGIQQGATSSLPAVAVAGGAFAVNPAFAAGVFDGSPRFLEVSVRPGNSAVPYTALSPRQEVTFVPYAVRSLSAATLDGVLPARLIQANTGGNVGIGTATPAAGYRLEVDGATILKPGNGSIQFGSPNAELGLSMTPTLGNRADLRFDGSVLKLLAGAGAGPPSSVSGIALTTGGNVGIGASPPTAGYRLEVAGATLMRPGNGTLQFGSPNAELGMSMTPTSGNRADIRFDGATLKLLAGAGAGPPSSAGGITISTAGNVGIGTAAPAAKLHVEGNAAQARGAGGFVKAMASINPFLPASQYVVRSYNSLPAESPAAITVERLAKGIYRIDFGFNVADRFFALTSRATSGGGQGCISDATGNRLTIIFGTEPFTTFDSAFDIIIY